MFFDIRGIVHHEYAPVGQRVTKEYYQQVLRRLRDAVRRKRPDLWTTKNWQLHHDNAPAFIAPDPVFLGETWNSSRSPTSLLSRHGSLRLLVVSEIEDDIERTPF